MSFPVTMGDHIEVVSWGNMGHGMKASVSGHFACSLLDRCSVRQCHLACLAATWAFGVSAISWGRVSSAPLVFRQHVATRAHG